ncbi:hypothetical protein MSG28_004507 [Choristoneura fumiferana]|uniref:Uncharacterized protein n=1 Tax=Choristoneura fumiferana TaxID=7141 RepID=A0ACC0K6X0_CHOFU|nr:hypothetical protein MSG28_004507 [Choristoneura fumiferana]
MGFNLPVFKKCCCCIPLRTGVVIVAYWSIFSKLLVMWLNIRVLASMMIETSKSGAVSKLLARAYMFRTLNIIALLVYIVLCAMLLKKPEYLRHFFMSSLVMTVIDVVVTAFAILYLHHWSFAIALVWIGNRFKL